MNASISRVAAAAVAITAAFGLGDASAATHTKSCPGLFPGAEALGISDLRATGVSCATARKVIKPVQASMVQGGTALAKRAVVDGKTWTCSYRWTGGQEDMGGHDLGSCRHRSSKVTFSISS